MKRSYNYIHQINVRVRYSETDQMGFCYYGNFLQFYEIGRVECLRSLNIYYKKMEEDGFFLPVLDVTVQYKHPCFYDDLLTVETKLVEISGSKILFEYTIRNIENTICNTAKTTLAFVNKSTKKATRCPDYLSKALIPYVE